MICQITTERIITIDIDTLNLIDLSPKAKALWFNI